jgi:hypothetical protein
VELWCAKAAAQEAVTGSSQEAAVEAAERAARAGVLQDNRNDKIYKIK